MKICVLGLWHLGTVAAACLASAGHHVVGLDFDDGAVAGLSRGKPPIFEPGLEDLVRSGLEAGLLDFSTSAEEAIRDAQVIWIAYDTPVDDEDNADVEYVVERASRLFPQLETGQEVVISSQVPVGTTRRMEEAFAQARPGVCVSFSYSPENLRLGKAVSSFTTPDRVVLGVRTERSREVLSQMLAPFTQRIESMSVESAEMTKHALNAFLATSVVFINEIAALCEELGANAKDVERGLKTDSRIGAGAYLSPGAAFAGGTLARDIRFLTNLGSQHRQALHVVRAVRASNDAHRDWPRRRLIQILKEIPGKTIALWGLTYKPGTDTLRRSSSIELAQWLLKMGASVRAHDPSLKVLPEQYRAISLCATPIEAVQGSDALVLATEWPDYRDVSMAQALAVMRTRIVIDANCFLVDSLGALPLLAYAAVGRPVPS